MTWMKRIFLFAVVNLLVVVTISTLLSFFNVQPYLQSYGIDYSQLMIFCLVWGMGGAFISLLLSKTMAKWMMGVQIIQAQNSTGEAAWLVNTVHRLAQSAGLPKMPEVGIYESPELNAFATGATRSSSLVAVSSGLLRRMDRDAVEGVLGHEVSHIANGDMVTMALLQGVINAFVMFFARVIAFAISQATREENQRGVNFMVVFVLEIFLSILGFMVVAAFSRWREFRADAGGASLTGREKMISALQALQQNLQIKHPDEEAHPAMATMQIFGKQGGFLALMSTHPPLEARIQKLRAG